MKRVKKKKLNAKLECYMLGARTHTHIYITHTYILIDVRDFVKSEKVQKFYSSSNLKELHNKRKPSTNTNLNNKGY